METTTHDFGMGVGGVERRDVKSTRPDCLSEGEDSTNNRLRKVCVCGGADPCSGSKCFTGVVCPSSGGYSQCREWDAI